MSSWEFPILLSLLVGFFKQLSDFCAASHVIRVCVLFATQKYLLAVDAIHIELTAELESDRGAIEVFLAFCTRRFLCCFVSQFPKN